MRVYTDELRVSAWSLNGSSSSQYVEGQTVVLACQSDSHGHVRLQWTKDGQPVPTQHDDDDGSTLRLADVTSTDAGQYVCVATRGHESATSDAVSVTVTGQLIHPRSPMFQDLSTAPPASLPERIRNRVKTVLVQFNKTCFHVLNSTRKPS